MWDSTTVYSLVVGGIGLFILGRIYVWSLISFRLRKRRIRRADFHEAVDTISPVDDPAAQARERGLASIERQYTVTQRTLLPGILVTFAVLMVLPHLDQLPASTVSLLAAGFAVVIGIAVRPLLENLVAGLVISTSRLINIGDTVKIDDKYGTVEDITPTHTSIKIWDWRRYVIPNSRMLQSDFINYSLFDGFMWTYVKFWVNHDADLEHVRELALAAAKESPHAADHEAPSFWVMELGKDAVECWVAMWADSAPQAWELSHEIRVRLVRSLRAEGIMPHRFHLEVGAQKAAAA